MILKKSKINKVDYTLKGEPYINSNKLQKNGTYKECQLPLSFEYNGQWIVSHNCNRCSSIIELREYPKKSFNIINKMFSKYYSGSLLNSISNLFESTKVLISPNSNWYFITSSKYEDLPKSDLDIPQKQFMNYLCSSCNAEYLCLFRQGYPVERDRINLEARLGTMYFDEIIEIQMENFTSFLDALTEHRIVI